MRLRLVGYVEACWNPVVAGEQQLFLWLQKPGWAAIERVFHGLRFIILFLLFFRMLYVVWICVVGKRVNRFVCSVLFVVVDRPQGPSIFCLVFGFVVLIVLLCFFALCLL